MNDRRRMLIAVAASVALHLAILAVRPWEYLDRSLPATRPPDPPLVVHLRPAAAPDDPPRALIETVQPAERPVEDAALLSDRDSNAQDPQDEVEGEEKAPLGTETEHFELAGGPTPGPEAAPSPPPAPEPSPPTPEASNEPEAEPNSQPEPAPEPSKSEAKPEPAPEPAPKPEPERPKPQARPTETPKNPREPTRQVVAKAETPAPQETRPSETPGDREMDLARVEPPVPAVPGSESTPAPAPAPSGPEPLPQPNPGTFRGSVEGGIRGEGFVGFEAMKHELAAYMLEVQRRVERNWRLVLGLEYTGTLPTKAELECAIAPDGSLVHVKILKAGGSPTFASLCQKSLERAAPFAPFPFEVPAIYRNKNLQIHWTFHFM